MWPFRKKQPESTIELDIQWRQNIYMPKLLSRTAELVGSGCVALPKSGLVMPFEIALFFGKETHTWTAYIKTDIWWLGGSTYAQYQHSGKNLAGVVDRCVHDIIKWMHRKDNMEIKSKSAKAESNAQIADFLNNQKEGN